VNGALEDASLSERDALKEADAIVEQSLGQPAEQICPLGGGLSNFVFAVKHEEGDFVLRMAPEPGRIADFRKQQWVQERVREAGVPTTDVVKVGSLSNGFAYALMRAAQGINARKHPDILAIVRQMGRMNALINAIPTEGYGRVFDWCGPETRRNESWRAFLDKEFHVDERIQRLRALGGLGGEQLATLRSIASKMRDWQTGPALAHGDMRLKNVLVNEQGAIVAVIDWDDCLSAVPPCWDLALALHDLSIDAKQAFLEGYGLSMKTFREAAPFIKALNLLHYAPFLEEAASAGDASRLAHLRQRLSGALDLYSLRTPI
jgi:hygromycin-B 4-O-kinase